MTKSWDDTWEKIYQSKEWGKYPPEELVRFIARNYYKAENRKAVKVLDVGCGTGAGTWFVAREGFDAYGVDGSETAIAIAKRRFEEERLEGHFSVGDIVELDFPDENFDAVIDIASIQHNSSENIQNILNEVHRVLKPGGKFFGMMLGECVDWNTGDYTTHHFTQNELEDFFKEFSNLSIESVVRTQNSGKSSLKFYIVEGEK